MLNCEETGEKLLVYSNTILDTCLNIDGFNAISLLGKYLETMEIQDVTCAMAL